MAGGQERILKRRIKSVQATRKTTRAMELIASSRIARAQQRLRAARPYVERVNSIVADVAAAPGPAEHRLLTMPETLTKVGIIVIAADRGLCGAYNSSVLRTSERRLRQLSSEGVDHTLVAVGRKAQSYFRYRGYEIDHVFTRITDRPTYENARQVAAVVARHFQESQLDSIELIATRFISAGVQKVETRPVVPLVEESGNARGVSLDYELEPDRGDLLEELAPMLIEARIFMALLEASASEHASRQRAMKAATDNADDLITTLRRMMNRVRQDSITTEIMDIVGAAEALRHAAGKPVTVPPPE